MTSEATKTKPGRLRRWGRRLVLGVLLLVGLGVALVGIVLLLLHTDYGREQVRTRVVEQFSALFVGPVEISRIEGSLLSEFELKGIRIADATGQDAISLRSLTLSYDLWSLWHKTVQIDRLELAGLSVNAQSDATGKVNLETLLVERPEEESSNEPPLLGFRLKLSRLTFRDAQLHYRADGQDFALAGLFLDASGSFADGQLAIDLKRLAAHYREQNLEMPVALNAQVAHSNQGSTVENVDLRVGDAQFHLNRLTLGAQGQLAASGRLDVPAKFVGLVSPATPLLADITLSFTAEKEHAKSDLSFSLKGRLADSSIQTKVRLAPNFLAGDLHLSLEDVDLSRVWAGQPQSRFSLVLDGSFEGTDVSTMVASCALQLNGRIHETEFDAFLLEGQLQQGIATVSLTPQEGPAWIDVNGQMRLLDQHVIALSASFDHGNIEQLLGPYVDVEGDIRMRATASGPLAALSVDGTVQSRRLRALGVRTRGLHASLTGYRDGNGFRGKAQLSLANLASNGTNVGFVSLRAQAQKDASYLLSLVNRGPRRSHEVQLRARALADAGKTTLELRKVLLRKGGLSVRGRRGLVELDGQNRLTLRNIRLYSKAGQLAVDGSVRVTDGSFDGNLLATASRVDLTSIQTALGLKPSASGLVSARISLDGRRRDRAKAGLTLRLKDVAMAETMPPTTGDLHLSLDGRTILLSANTETRDLGPIAIVGQARAPRNPLVFADWARLDERALRSLEVKAPKLRLEAISAFDPQLPRSGSIGVYGQLGQAAQSGNLRVAVRDLKHAEVPSVISADVSVDLQKGNRLSLDTNANVPNRGSVQARVQATAPGPWLRPRTWDKLRGEHLTLATWELSDLDVDWWLQQLGGKDAERYGVWLDANGTIDAKNEMARVHLRAAQPKGLPDGNTPSALGEVHAAIGAHRLDVSVRGLLNKRRVLHGSAALRRGWRDLSSGLEGFADAPIAADVNLDALPLAPVARLTLPSSDGNNTSVRGSLTASASLRGTWLTPRWTLQAQGDKVAFHKTEFDELRLAGKFDGKRAIASLRAGQRRGGDLRLSGTLLLPKATITNGSLVVRNWDLAFLQSFAPSLSLRGKLDANLRIGGTQTQPILLGTAALRGGRLQPGAPLSTLRNLNLTLQLADSTATIAGSGTSGTGRFTLNGSADLPNLRLQSVTAKVRLRDMPVQAGPVAARVDSETDIRGRVADGELQVGVDVGDSVITVLGQETRTLHDDSLPDDIVFVDSKSPATAKKERDKPTTESTATAVALRVWAPMTVAVRGDVVRTTVAMDLRAKVAAKLRLEGTVAARSGWIDLFGRRYDLRTAEVLFDGSPDPTLNVELSHEFTSMTLYVLVSGTGSNPELTLRADPSRYDEAQLLAFLLGASPDEQGPSDQTAGQQAAGVASAFLAGKLQDAVREVVPIDVLKVELAEEETAAERLTLGKWLTSKLFLAYRRTFEATERENANEAVLEYRFARRWLLETFYGDAGTGGADILWFRRF